ncbi:MAG: hypothetical protein AB1689_28130 [Thermodesulfobacteriota bacterium]
MRTTLTLDDDVAREIERLRTERRAGLKETINEVLRAGIVALKGRPRRPGGRPTFRTEPASLGTPRLKSLDNVDEVLSLGEGEDYR